MTGLKLAKAILREHGMTINKVAATGEYRVNFTGGAEATAYYSDDIVDAVATGKDMAARRSAMEPAELRRMIADL